MRTYYPTDLSEYVPSKWVEYVETNINNLDNSILDSDVEFSIEEIEAINAIDQEQRSDDDEWSGGDWDNITTRVSANVPEKFEHEQW